MAEIRIRDARPELIKNLDAISQELHEATITGTVERMIPRYWDMKKRIKEQNDEIAKTVNELRREQQRCALMHQDLVNLIIETRDFSRAIQGHLKGLEKRYKQFGTKKQRPPAAAPGTRSKIVPGKKKPARKK